MDSKNVFITKSSGQTRKLGEFFAAELRGGEIICLMGELGSGKTTFVQGVLKGLGAKGPYTSPTFVVMKHYGIRNQESRHIGGQAGIRNVYHTDAYRVNAHDVSDLGWEEIVSSENNIVIVEWAERIRNIVPKRAIWIKFEHLEGDERKIILK